MSVKGSGQQVDGTCRDIDAVYGVIGEFGTGQRRVFYLLLLLSVYTALQSLQMVFVGAEPEFYCYGSSSYYKCSTDTQQPACNRYVFTGNFTSIVSEWSLVCDASKYSKLVQSLYMGGLSVGAVLFGQLGDRCGRRGTLGAAILLTVAASLVSTVLGQYTPYAAARAVCGVGVGGIILTLFVLLTELVGASARTLCGIATAAAFSLGICLLSLLAYLLPHWRHLSACVTALGMLFIPLYRVLPESPRWLLIKGRQKAAEAVLRRFALANGTKYPESVELEPPAGVTIRSVAVGGHKSGAPSVADLFRNATIRRWTLIQLWSWFVNSATYYGLSMVGQELASNMYVSSFMLGLVELPAYMMVLPLMNWLGRRRPLFGFMSVGGSACLLIMLLPHGEYMYMTRTVLALVGKLGISASFALIYVHSAEMFPTSIRGVAMSLCTIAARIGGVMSPFLAALGSYHENLQFIVFGVGTVSAALLNLRLPCPRHCHHTT